VFVVSHSTMAVGPVGHIGVRTEDGSGISPFRIVAASPTLAACA
jgi:hypothetical protein